MLLFVRRFLWRMYGLVDHVWEAWFVKFQQYFLGGGVVSRQGDTNDILEIFVKVNVGIRNKRYMGSWELYDAVKCLVGNVVTMAAFLQSNKEPTAIELFNMVWVDSGSPLIARKGAV